MLFRSSFRQGLEPVGHMGGAMFHCPLLDPGSHAVSCLSVKRLTAFDAGQKGGQTLRIKILVHFVAVEDQFAEIFRSLGCGDISRNDLPDEGFFH